MATVAQDCYEAAFAADANVSAAVISPDPRAVDTNGWTVYTRVDGLVFTLRTTDGAEPLQAAIDAVMNLDLTASAVNNRDALRDPNRVTLRSQVVQFVQDLATYKALATPSAAQRLAWERRVCDALT
jgi:hypothetical protein